MLPPYRIIDISQPVCASTACFPGDTPFQQNLTVSYAQSQVINLTAFTMSPHVGTHADAPLHIQGDMVSDQGHIGEATLEPYIGPAYVLDCSPWSDALEVAHVQQKLEALPVFPRRILLKTAQNIRYEVFESQYASISPALATYLGDNGVVLVGLDTPSVDPIDSKTLEAHHILLQNRLAWLENLDLTQVTEGDYFLIAPPLKFMELEASPLRAILLSPHS